MPADTHTWHAPTDHEHGDAPPAWADAFSCASFGHPVVFGGDESTPGEVAGHHEPMTHIGFKGFAWTATADDGQPIDLFLRVHLHTNPHGRSTQRHSYEWYAARDGVVLGLWQGWLDFGAAPDDREVWADGRTSGDIINPIPYPKNFMLAYPEGVDEYHVTFREFWYAQQSTPGGWDPSLVLQVYDPSTYYVAGEEVNPANMAAWQFTGDHGLDRRVLLRWVAGGSPANGDSQPGYMYRNMDDPRGWFCATPTGDITSTGSAVCASGSLPQFISTNMPTIGDTNAFGNAFYRKVWPCSSCGSLN